MCGSSSLVLKEWHSPFDPRTKSLLIQHLWALLRGFPLPLWSMRDLEEVGKMLRKVVYIDEVSLENMDKRLAHVLVEVNVSKSLIPKLEAEWWGKTFIRKVDYWKNTF